MSTPFQKIEVAPGITLSEPLAAHWAAIAGSRRPFIKIDPTPSPNLPSTRSSFGNLPLLPKGFAYPEDAAGNPLFPLATINFAEVPPLEPFPTSGYLQFFCTVASDDYGSNYNDLFDTADFRVLYFTPDEVASPQTHFNFLNPIFEHRRAPMRTPHALSFQPAEGYMGPGEIAFDANYAFSEEISDKYPELADELERELWRVFALPGHRLGGYAYFNQEDPRYEFEYDPSLMLLLQIDHNQGKRTHWNFHGTAQFLIDPAALAARDFSAVAFNWDD
ncbi:MAG TPA: DUF1963 domain-containing protein [Dinghuibacter sp.]|jgi:uncharacterized protein YwqG|uniref:YwqG family protein n=1 Tax=Dinghuibacter sp. TaxID=2024697 RepID=UPI002C9C172E|nr:DUF1963 domain-containing protein [Dinghuibacter sp.]HTJ12849.1 DUF1963 domain-containing protein [Dinghuibacter sp.]